MMDIDTYRQHVAEMKGKINAAAEKIDLKGIDNVVLAVQEEQLVKKLKDKDGIILAGNIPGYEVTRNNGWCKEDGDSILMIINKVPAGKMTDEEELSNYSKLGKLMQLLCDVLTGIDSYDCDNDIYPAERLKVEYEYNIYGGYNGMSVTFKLTTA